MLEQAVGLSEIGFALHWLHQRSKRPIGKDWANKPVNSPQKLRDTFDPKFNLGVRLGKWSNLSGFFLYIIDVDIRKPELAQDALDKLGDMLPELNTHVAPCVVSGSGGASRHYYLLCDKPFPSRKFAHSPSFTLVWDDDKGRDVKKWDWELHLLGTGSQAVIPPSIHPDTGKRYKWIREFDRFDFEFGAIDPVPADALERLVGYESVGEINPERLRPMGLSLSDMRDYLVDLPVETWVEDRDGWYRLGMAIHHETAGSVAGFDLWCEISRQSKKFDERDSKRVWKSFKDRSDRLPFRMASIVAVVNDMRMESEFEDYGEDDLEAEVAAARAEDEATAPGMFDDLLGDANGNVPGRKPSKSQVALARQQAEDALGKEVPKWIRRMNQKHALLRNEGRTVVMDFKANGDVAFGSVSDLHQLYENDRRPKDDTTVPVSKLWMQHTGRRTYPNGVVFLPGKDLEGTYNYWQGFSVEPDGTKSCALFLRHLREVYCQNDEDLFSYLIRYFAHLVQQPEDKPGVALVVRGGKGWGKDTLFEYIGRLCMNHYVGVSHKDHVVGKFNHHVMKCLVLHMEEAFWAGDKAADGQLKSLITRPTILIEPKGLNPFTMNSVLRLFITSNEDWVVPATPGERRYCVLDASSKYKGNHAYFRALRAEMDGDGPAALLHYLLGIDLTGFEVREVPNTAALGEQKLQGLKNVDRWWFDVLQQGYIEGFGREADNIDTLSWANGDVRVAKAELREVYERWLRTRRYDGEALSPVHFTRRLRYLLPGMVLTRYRGSAGLTYGFVIPDLQRARTEFETAIGSVINWEGEGAVVDETEDDDLSNDEGV